MLLRTNVSLKLHKLNLNLGIFSSAWSSTVLPCIYLPVSIYHVSIYPCPHCISIYSLFKITGLTSSSPCLQILSFESPFQWLFFMVWNMKIPPPHYITAIGNLETLTSGSSLYGNRLLSLEEQALLWTLNFWKERRNGGTVLGSGWDLTRACQCFWLWLR